MKYKAIIFDLDGVICHTDKYHYEAWKRLADTLNIYFDETINNRLRGVSRMESLEIILERHQGKALTEKEKEDCAEEKNNIYKELLKKMSPSDLDDEVKITLQILREKGYLLAIGSSSKNARFILQQIGLGDFFDVISDGNNIKYSKPNPEVFLRAAQELKVEPKDCLVIEDAHSGVAATIVGGMDCAGIGEAAKCRGVNYSLESFKDILCYV